MPANSATDIDNGTRLTWAAATGTPTGYRLTFGSNSPNYDNIANNVDLGNVLFYNTSYAFVNGTVYGFKIVPYNGVGPATGCSFNTFTANDNVRLLANGSITKCSGNFYDSGGSGSAYSSNEDYTLTICPSVGTDKVSAAFSAFATESGWDGMVIYNGNSIAAPIISSGLVAGSSPTNCPAGSYYGGTSPGTVTSTAVNGCLTFRFRSDSGTNGAGWAAAITCAAPPSCPAPSSFAASGTTGTSTNLAWTENGTATVWDVYRAATSTPVPTTSTVPTYNDVANPYNVTGLSATTTYYFWVPG
ncbi:MAG: hypothetical protein IPL27_13665 [Lewinellaceae bacterium]|nr:hypothetical protein [Lewinellaceae bacterium]